MSGLIKLGLVYTGLISFFSGENPHLRAPVSHKEQTPLEGGSAFDKVQDLTKKSSHVPHWLKNIENPHVHSPHGKDKRLLTYESTSFVSEKYALADNGQLLRITGYPLDTCICGGTTSSLKCATASVTSNDESSLVIAASYYSGNYCTDTPSSSENFTLSETVVADIICDVSTNVTISYSVTTGSNPYANYGGGILGLYYGFEDECSSGQWTRYDFFPNYNCFCNATGYGTSYETYLFTQYTDSTCTTINSQLTSQYHNQTCYAQKNRASDDISLVSKLNYCQVQILEPVTSN